MDYKMVFRMPLHLTREERKHLKEIDGTIRSLQGTQQLCKKYCTIAICYHPKTEELMGHIDVHGTFRPSQY